MAKNKKISPKTPPPVIPAGVEFYFDKFAAAHQHPTNKIIQIVGVPLIIFGLFGLVWAIPFPYIAFLGIYNQDFNWSSFLIAGCVYFYLKLSPVLGFFMLFILLAYSYIITQLQLWQKTGGPQLWLVSGIVFVLSFALLYLGYKKEGKRLSLEYRYKNMLIAPVFLLHLVLKRFSVKY